MIVTFTQQCKAYLGLAVFYYCGLLFFVDRLLKGGRGDDLMAENAAGNLARQLGGVLLLGWGMLLLYWQHRELVRRVLTGNLWWWVLIGFFAASITWSYAPGVSFRRLIAFFTLVVTSATLVSVFSTASLLRFLAYTIVAVAAIGVLYSLVDPSQSLTGFGDRSRSFVGIMFDKNGGARLYAYAALLMIGLGLYQHWAQRLAIVMLVYCVLAANSATAVIILLAGFALLFLFHLMHARLPRVNIARVLMLGLVLLVGAILINLLYSVLLEALGRDPTLTNRQLIWALIEQHIAEHLWLGYGFGAFWASDAVLDFVARWGFIGNAHSGYYEVLLHGGLVGLAILVLLILKTFADLLALYIRWLDVRIPATLLTLLMLQCVVNYVGYVILNQNSADMFLFTLTSFIATLQRQRLPVTREPASFQGVAEVKP